MATDGKYSPAAWLRNRADAYRLDAAYQARRGRIDDKGKEWIVPGLSADQRRAIADELLDCARDFDQWRGEA